MDNDIKIEYWKKKEYPADNFLADKPRLYPSTSGGYNLLQIAFAMIVLGLLSASFIQIYSQQFFDNSFD